ncbi:MAG: hypothetical protein HY343_00980 [Lentisphaerae bacterium]|nr:hypothetical protein [Lentisphaerota bacterium]
MSAPRRPANGCWWVLGLVISLSLSCVTASAQKGPPSGDGPADVQTMIRDFKRLVAEKEQRGEDTSQAMALYGKASEALRRGDKGEYLRLITAALQAAGGAGGGEKGKPGKTKTPAKQTKTADPDAPAAGKAADPAKGIPAPRSGEDDSPFGIHPLRNRGFQSPYEAAADIGVRFERLETYFFWGEVQPDLENPELTWSRSLGKKGKTAGYSPSYDQVVTSVPASIRVVANFSAAYHEEKGRYTPRSPALYQTFVRATVERYDGDGIADVPNLKSPIKYWQVENEPDVRKGGYLDLLHLTAEAIRAADPSARVLAAGAIGDFDLACIQTYYEPLFSRLNPGEIDIVDLHWFRHAWGSYLGVEPLVRSIQDSMREKGIRADIWITEMGTYSGKPRGKGGRGQEPDQGPLALPFVPEDQHAADVLKRYVYGLHLGVKKIFLAFGLKEGFGRDGSYFDLTGLIFDGEFDHDRGSGVKKLAYYTYKLMTEKLEGCDWNDVSSIPAGAEDVHVYRFRQRRTGSAIYVAWRDWFSNNDRQAALPMTIEVPIQGEEALVTTAVTGFDGERDTRTLRTTRGVLRVPLGQHPIFVEEATGTPP